MSEIQNPNLRARQQQLGASSGATAFTSPPVYLGGGSPRFIERRTAPETFTGPLADPEQAFRTIPEQVEELVEEAPEATSTITDLIDGLFRMEPDELRELQAELEAGGYFTVRPENIGWGRPDRATQQAYGALLEEAAGYFQAGVRKPLDAILNEAGRAREEAREMEQEPTEVTRLSDPAAIRSVVRRMARELTGGDVDEETTSRFVSEIRQAQAAAQRQIHDAEEGSSVTVDDVDPQARIEGLLRSEFPERVAGTQGADGYRMFTSLLRPGGIG